MNYAAMTGRELDLHVAFKQGYVWATTQRDRHSASMFPAGHRFVVNPNRSKGLNSETPNWDGWLEAKESDPVNEHWKFNLPKYSTDWSEIGPIIHRVGISVAKRIPPPGTEEIPEQLWSAWIDDYGLPQLSYGTTPMEAACRLYLTLS